MVTVVFNPAQAYESPLLVAVAAGAVALPTLLKLSAILEAQGQSITSMEELPVELELGKVHAGLKCGCRVQPELLCAV